MVDIGSDRWSYRIGLNFFSFGNSSVGLLLSFFVGLLFHSSSDCLNSVIAIGLICNEYEIISYIVSTQENALCGFSTMDDTYY